MKKNFPVLAYFLGSVVVVGFIAKSLDFVVDRAKPIPQATTESISCAGVAPNESYRCKCLNGQCLWVQE